MIFLSKFFSFCFSNNTSLQCLAACRTRCALRPGSALPLPAEEGRFLHHHLVTLTSNVGPVEVLGV